MSVQAAAIMPARRLGIIKNMRAVRLIPTTTSNPASGFLTPEQATLGLQQVIGGGANVSPNSVLGAIQKLPTSEARLHAIRRSIVPPRTPVLESIAHNGTAGDVDAIDRTWLRYTAGTIDIDAVVTGWVNTLFPKPFNIDDHTKMWDGQSAQLRVANALLSNGAEKRNLSYVDFGFLRNFRMLQELLKKNPLFFENAILRHARFVGLIAPFDSLSFKGAILCDASFVDCHLAESSFKSTDLRNARFAGGNLRKASFEWADMRGAQFDRVNLSGAEFRGSRAGIGDNWIKGLSWSQRVASTWSRHSS